MSSHLSSRSHVCSNCSKYTTDGDINKMSSAYKIIKHPICELHSLPRSSIYRANRNGDNTEPCLTPKSIKTHDYTLFHFTQEKQPESKFSNNKVSGIRLFICFMYSAWWFTLSKDLERSIAQRFTVLPAVTKHKAVDNITNVILRGYWLHPRCFLNPNWFSLVNRRDWNFSRKQHSNSLDSIGLIAIPRKSLHTIALVRLSLNLGIGTSYV